MDTELSTLPIVDQTSLANIIEFSDDSTDVLAELTDMFLGETPARIAAILSGAESQDCEKVRRVAHALVNSASNFGAHRLSGMCRALEKDARSGHISDAGPQVSEIAEECDLVRQILEDIRHQR